MERESNGELPQSIMCAYARAIGSEDLASGSHTKYWTRETAFQPTQTCFAARQLTGSLAYATKILICQLCKRQETSREVSLAMALHRCLVKSLCQQPLALSLAQSIQEGHVLSVLPGQPPNQKQGVIVQALGQMTWKE